MARGITAYVRTNQQTSRSVNGNGLSSNARMGGGSKMGSTCTLAYGREGFLTTG
jgi:hypothetical protein